MYARIQRAFAHRHALVATFLAALLLGGVSIVSGFAADDHIHQLIVSGSRALPGIPADRLDLFRFATPRSTPLMMDEGVFPWWADPQVNFGFFRPLTSWLHAVDHALSPNDPVWAHVHTMLWHALGLLALWWLYRALITPRWVAVLALFVYALDDARGGPLTWVANRHAVIGTTLSLACLCLFHHARTLGEGESKRRGLSDVTAWLVFVLALLASQGSASTCGYLFAHALYLQHDNWSRRLARLLPYGIAVIGWALWSRALGYGVHGSDVYFDPVSQPLLFLRAFVERGPALWLSQLASPWSEVWNLLPLFAPWLVPVLIGVALLVCGAWAVALAPLWRTQPSTRFFTLGALISTLPAAAAFPADRLLTWLAIGASALIAQTLGHVIEHGLPTAGLPRLVTRLVGWSIVVFHLVLAPLLLPGRAIGTRSTRRSLDLADNSLPATADITDKTVVIINPPSDAYVGYIQFRRAADDIPRPDTMRWLATGITPVHVTRIDAHTLRVHQEGGFLQAMSEQLLRSPRTPFSMGQTIALRDFTVTIVRITAQGRPLEIDVRFGHPLNDARYLWLMWRGKGYVPFPLPAIGERVVVPPFDPLAVAFG